ncbi:MAG TPA: hypothetical protein VEO01_20225, partial [Pseudonocardiaceae bacterium]|nr:hypothetical protein [Pseudonocardiaceae bacterium]
MNAEQTARPPGDGEQPEPEGQAAHDLLVRLIAAIERRERDPIEVTPALLAAIRRARTFDDAAYAELEQLSAQAESTGDYRYRDERSACDLTFGRCLAVVADWAVTGTQSAPGVIVRP